MVTLHTRDDIHVVALGTDENDRGHVCLSEVDIQIRFTSGVAALLQAKVSPRTAINATATGRRFGGPDALALGRRLDGLAAPLRRHPAVSRTSTSTSGSGNHCSMR